MKTLKLIKGDESNEIRESDIADVEKVIGEIEIVMSGDFVGKAIYLSNKYDYVLGEDCMGHTILVPLKKGCCK